MEADRVHDVSWLIDKAEISELTARYGRYFDDGDPEAFATTFTEDGVMEVTGGWVTTGRAGLEDMCRNTRPGTMHVVTDQTLELDGDKATQVVTILVLKKARAKTEQPKLVSTGRYTDSLVRTPEGWRFAKRSVALDGWDK
jgi:uncharacterized protein (TIGR02246 family)